MKHADTSTRRNKSNTRHKADLSLSKVRSAISNGSSILGAEIDHRSAWMRRYRDLIAAHMSDLGGEDSVSAAEKVLVRRASMLTLQLEMMEQRFAQRDGEAAGWQLDRYQRVVNTLRRALESLGLERRPRDITPDRTPQIIELARSGA